MTLTETMSVIGIISMLSSVLYPVTVESRKRSYESTCQSNLRQMGLALDLYFDDHDGGFPNFGYSPENMAGSVVLPIDWVTRELGIEAKHLRDPADRTSGPDGMSYWIATSFGMWGYTEAEVPKPHETIWSADAIRGRHRKDRVMALFLDGSVRHERIE